MSQQDIEKARLRMQPTLVRMVKNALNSQVDDIATAYRNGFPNPDQLVTETPIRNMFVQLYSKVGQYFGTRVYKLLGGLKQPSFLRAMELFVTTQCGDSIKRITNTTRKIVRRVINKGLQQGWSTDKIAKNLRNNWIGLSRNRSIVIARTESLTASNEASLQGALDVSKELGVKMRKTWESTRDKRTRDPHRRANGQTVDIEEDFTVGGEKLSYPGDIKASAKNRVQCRCSVSYEVV